MMFSSRSTRKGFTLVELAIVLAIAGVLFVGLWRLMSGGNAQVRDQNAASQQGQLINAYKAYLASSWGQSLLTAMAANAKTVTTLPVNAPTGTVTGGISNSACKGGVPTTNATAICDFLPIGFSSATTNSYSQTYIISILKDNSAATVAPQTYSFMIMTVGGDVIHDSSGGRIASSIGTDGGFIYSSTVCNAPASSWACGAYGTWSSTIVPTYFTAANPGVSGTIASRTFVSPSGAASTSPWLERNLTILPDPNFLYNTMNADLYMGDTANTGAATNTIFHLSSYAASLVVPPASLNQLNLEGGKLVDSSLIGTVTLGTPAGQTRAFETPGGANSPLTLGTNCTTLSPSPSALLTADPLLPVGGPPYVSGCKPALTVLGDIGVLGQVIAGQTFAGEFYYNSDIRLKKDILPLKSSLDDVLKLKPVNYVLKATNKKDIGFIAQDIEKIYPELVSNNGSDGMKAVNYMGLVAPMVSAIQELKRENDDLRHQLHEQQLQQEILWQHMIQEKAN